MRRIVSHPFLAKYRFLVYNSSPCVCREICELVGGRSSFGRALAFQAGCSRFETDRPLQRGSRARGGIGRRTRLRIWRITSCGFKSLRAHQWLKLLLFFLSECSSVGRVLVLGTRCRRFESCHSDQKKTTSFFLNFHYFNHIFRHTYAIFNPSASFDT